jgi:hypothetical protein
VDPCDGRARAAAEGGIQEPHGLTDVFRCQRGLLANAAAQASEQNQ